MNQIAIMESKIEVLGKQVDEKEKELKAEKLVWAIKEEQMRDNFQLCKDAAEYWKNEVQEWKNSRDGIMAENEALVLLAENLKCCGNCGLIASILCPKYYVGIIAENYDYWRYCYNWQSDGITRKDREK